jgi:hypothetical protein
MQLMKERCRYKLCVHDHSKRIAQFRILKIDVDASHRHDRWIAENLYNQSRITAPRFKQNKTFCCGLNEFFAIAQIPLEGLSPRRGERA